MPSLILASTSRYRHELLSRLALPFRAEPPRCDEEALKDPRLGPAALAGFLAREKALSVAARAPEAHVLGSDQLVDVEGEVLGKPGSLEGAKAQLRRLAGRSHRLITAVALACPDGRVLEHLDVTTLVMRPLSPEEIARYVALDRPEDCAGSYKIERLGISLFEQIDCRDFTAITGLPLMAVAGLLRAQGFGLP